MGIECAVPGTLVKYGECPYAVTVEYLTGLSPVRGIIRFASVVQGSGVLVTEGRKFPIGKAAGRN